jgi:hypothetical protein
MPLAVCFVFSGLPPTKEYVSRLNFRLYYGTPAPGEMQVSDDASELTFP